MKLFVDLETLQLIEATGFRNPVTSLRFKRGDGARLEVAFLTGGTTPATIGNPATLQLRFGVKERNRFDLDYLVYATDWTMPDPEATSPVYECSPSFNTVELDAALHVGAGNELSEITLMGEITWSERGGEPTSTRTFLVVVENDVVRGDGITPTRAASGLGSVYLPAYRVSPNNNSPYSTGGAGANNAIVFTLGAGAEVILLAIRNTFDGHGNHAITVTGTTVKAVTIDQYRRNSFAVTGTFFTADNTRIDTAAIPALRYAGTADGYEWWTDTGDPVTYNHYVVDYGAGLWGVGGNDAVAGNWSFQTDPFTWPDQCDFTDCGNNGEHGTPIVTPCGATAAEIIALINGDAALTGSLSCAASGASTGGVGELAATIRCAVPAAYPGQACIVGDAPGPFDQFLNTTFPNVWTQVLDRRAAAVCDSGTVGRALVRAETPADVGNALGGFGVTYEYTTGHGSIPLEDGAKSVSFVIVGGGGGGGSGRRGAAGSVRCGGGGGSAGSVITMQPTPVERFAWPWMYSIGTGGTKGTAVTADNTNGQFGGMGGTTILGPFSATGGGPGGGGTATSGLAGGPLFSSMLIPSNTVAGSSGGAAQTTGSGIAGTGTDAPMLLPTGGGAGGGISSSNVYGHGGNGGRAGDIFSYSVAGGSGASAGAGNASVGIQEPVTLFGTGGGGGGASATTPGNGGDGGLYGGGGGGGGASINGHASGSGGKGGNGFIAVTFHY